MSMLQTTIRPRRSSRRGIILVFVVVLLVLLAIMGTAYLASTRADLVTIRGRGAGLNPNNPLLNDRTTLDDLFAQVGTQIKTTVAADANGQVDHPQVDAWLSSLLPQPNTTTPTNIEWPWISAPLAGAPGSSLLDNAYIDPRRPGSPVLAVAADREDVRIGAIALMGNTNMPRDRTYPGLLLASASTAFIAGDADGDGIADSFLMPLVINESAAGVNRYVDEKNGVIYTYSYRVVDNSAQLNLGTALARTGDFPILPKGDNNPANNDNDANDETRRLIALIGEQTLLPNLVPNYGFFRSNIGLTELIREATSIYDGQTGQNRPFEKELRRLVDLRFPDLQDDPLTTDQAELSFMISPNTKSATPSDVAVQRYPTGLLAGSGDDAANAGGTSDQLFFRSYGDAIEQQVLKHPTTPQRLFMGLNGSTFLYADFAPPPGSENLTSLHEKGGTLINSLIAAGPVETALWLSLRNPTPNFASRTDGIWGWFPPDQIALWYEWTKNLNNLGRTASNDPNFGDAATFTFNPAIDPVQLGGMTSVELQRSLRSIVTTRNGLSAAAPVRSDTPPVGMPVYPAAGAATVNLDAAPFGEYPASKVSAATGTKRQLWRAYWSAMTRSGGTGGWEPETTIEPPFMSAARYTGSAARLTERDMVLIRSAIAAVNTIDLRDSDDDITELDVELEQTTVVAGRTAKFHARVLGTEKRPYITEIFYANKPTADSMPAGGPFLAVEIYNPHDVPLDLTNYYIGVLTRTGGTFETGTLVTDTPAVSTVRLGDVITSTINGGTTPPATLGPGQYLILTSGTAPPDVPLVPTTAAAPIAAIGTLDATSAFATAAGAGARDLVLARYRRADGVPTNDPSSTAAFPQGRYRELPDTNPRAIERMVPLETIPMNYLTPTTPTAPVAFSYRRYATDPAGTAVNRWKCVYGGRFYDIQVPTSGGPPVIAPDPNARPFDPTPAAPASGDEQLPAWRKYEGYELATPPAPPVPGDADGAYRVNETDNPAVTVPLHTLGVHEPDIATPNPLGANNEPIPAPSIQIHNFDPDPTVHDPRIFPFGSPFARDIDILNVPYIGAYQIYRVDPNGNATSVADDIYALFENNGLPTDAFLADPKLTAPANLYLGRFIGFSWTTDLFDHISARQAPMHDFFPDVPKINTLDRDGADDPSRPQFDDLNDNDTMDFSEDPTLKLAYVGGDGKIRGRNGPNGALGAPNTDADVVRYAVGNEDPKREGVLAEDVKGMSEANALVQGRINLNTAPPVVLQMLPWVVDPATGLSDDTQVTNINDIVDEVVSLRDSGPPLASIFDLQTRSTLLKQRGQPNATAANQLLNVGDLSGKTNKPAFDFQTDLYNTNRISNLVSFRSDVFTVYYTVQAWTYRPNSGTWNQTNDTRLVGERRGAFVLDRSQYVPGPTGANVLTFPIINE